MSSETKSLQSNPENDFSTQAPGPNSYSQQAGSAGTATGDATKPKPRSRLSSEEHAALTVLNDEELLTMYALKTGRVSTRPLDLIILNFSDSFISDPY